MSDDDLDTQVPRTRRRTPTTEIALRWLAIASPLATLALAGVYATGFGFRTPASTLSDMARTDTGTINAMAVMRDSMVVFRAEQIEGRRAQRLMLRILCKGLHDGNLIDACVDLGVGR